VTRQSYQQGHISGPHDTRGGKAFRIRYRVRTSAGKWKQRSEMLYGLSGKKEARSVLDIRIRESSTATSELSELTLRSFVEGYWKPYLDRKSLKPSTRKNYDSVLENHILPALGDHRITDICPMHIEQLVQAKSKAGLSGKTVRNLVLLLQGIYSLAVDNDLVVKSPIRKSHKPICRRKEKPIWSPETIAAILSEAPQPYRALFYCVALTGVRQGELLGLQWKHVNLTTHKLRIEQSLWHGQLVAPKTTGSVRTICLGNVLAEVLAAHFQQTAHKAPEDFVFCTKEGSPLHPDLVRKDVLYPILDRLRIARTPGESGFHTFRHSAASILNERTGNLKLAQKLLGHSNISTTADVYTHISEESEREAALTVEEAICGSFVPDLFPTGNKTSNAAVN
jgi:integrase